MRGTILPHCPSRVKGRQAMHTRARRFYLAAVRYLQHRAKTPDDERFGAVLVDGLRQVLDSLDACDREPGDRP